MDSSFWRAFQDDESIPRMVIDRVLSASDDNLFHNLTNNNNGFDRRSSNNSSSSSNGQDTYEFVAFVLWYMFLVLCCVVPTCCAYRRRRLVEARLAQQQFDLHRLQQQQPNFLILDQLSSARRNSERYRRARSEVLSDNLKGTTMTLAEGNFEEVSEKAPEATAPPDVEQPASDGGTADLFGDETTAKIRLPSAAVNANRTVPGFCAICLCPYEPLDKVSWSPETACQHAFHTDCIVPWLAKKDEPKCPVCRQDYCQAAQISEEELGVLQPEEDIFLDSFALALNYARSQAVHNWASTTEDPNQLQQQNQSTPNVEQGARTSQVEMTAVPTPEATAPTEEEQTSGPTAEGSGPAAESTTTEDSPAPETTPAEETATDSSPQDSSTPAEVATNVDSPSSEATARAEEAASNNNS